jgi:hypothetical protein
MATSSIAGAIIASGQWAAVSPRSVVCGNATARTGVARCVYVVTELGAGLGSGWALGVGADGA